MDEFVIEGGAVLSGAVTPSGNKNAAFPLIAAALLTDQPVVLRNLPDIEDVRTMLQVVEGLGVGVTRQDAHTITIRAREISTDTPDPRLLRRIRGALVLIGPLLARRGSVRVGRFGGDQIGRRRIDTHVTGLQELGVKAEHGADLVLSTAGLSGQDLLLEEAELGEALRSGMVMVEGERELARRFEELLDFAGGADSFTGGGHEKP